MEFEIQRSGIMHELAALFLASKTAADLCRGMVMHPVLGKHAIGAELLVLSQNATLRTLAHFGSPLSARGETVSLWDPGLIAEASRSNKVTRGKFRDPETDKEVFVYCYPCSSLTQTVGIIALLKSQEYDVELKEEDQITLALVGALWLESVGASGLENQQGDGTETPEDLTGRQKAILQKIAEGKTNAQIAALQLVSESTVRQETMKIYASLSVSGRTEAAKRAVHLGLVKKVEN